ncbi:MAG: ribonuclease III [Moraxellaceae bacterium]|nr:ribonuclease III [Moraxellaceae bacterium]
MVAVHRRVIENRLGHVFGRAALLEQALTHRSFSADHNERLEFLGDGILNMVIAEALYVRFADLREGELSRLRAQLVRQDALQKIAERLGVGECLRLGDGELKSGGHRRPSILADAVEALFGAVYLDAGFDAARSVILRLYTDSLASLDPARQLKDPKTTLQELLQARRLPLPQYSLVEVRGEAHAQEFEVSCQIALLKEAPRGVGVSRRAAEQAAAEAALAALETK